MGAPAVRRDRRGQPAPDIRPPELGEDRNLPGALRLLAARPGDARAPAAG
jgi:hypothetical protein